MTTAVFYIQLGKKEEIHFGNPFNRLPSAAVCFELDNHSDQLSLQYAGKLLEDSDSVVLVICQHSQAQFGHLSGFLEKIVRKHRPKLITFTIGEVQLPPGMIKKLSPANRTADEVEEFLSKED